MLPLKGLRRKAGRMTDNYMGLSVTACQLSKTPTWKAKIEDEWKEYEVDSKPVSEQGE